MPQLSHHCQCCRVCAGLFPSAPQPAPGPFKGLAWSPARSLSGPSQATGSSSAPAFKSSTGLTSRPSGIPASLQGSEPLTLSDPEPSYRSFTFTLPDRKTKRTVKVYLQSLPWAEASQVCASQGGSLFVADRDWELVVLKRAVAEAIKVSGARQLSELWLGTRAVPVPPGTQTTATGRPAGLQGAVDWRWSAGTAADVQAVQGGPALVTNSQPATARSQADKRLHSRRLLAAAVQGSQQDTPSVRVSASGGNAAGGVLGMDLHRLTPESNPWLPYAQTVHQTLEQHGCLMQRVWSHMAGSAWIVGADCRQARPFACSGLP
jgi:hypothetical protein